MPGSTGGYYTSSDTKQPVSTGNSWYINSSGVSMIRGNIDPRVERK